MNHNYEDYQNLIYFLANRFHYTTGIETDELISCGNLEFVRSQETYNPAKAKFSTYFYTRLTGLFIEMARKQRSQPTTVNLDKAWQTDLPSSPSPERNCIFKEIILGLPADAKEVVKIAFNTPMDLINMLPKKQPRGINKSQIQKYLRQQGWTFPRIWAAFSEIKNALLF